jgi:heme oxygenase
MTTLKELTWTAHKKAESTPLMTSLLNNEISVQCYSDLVHSKYQIYQLLEQRIHFKTPCLKRASAAFDDWREMGQLEPAHIPSLVLYIDHLNTLREHQLWSHAYVHYLAPLYGGQIIKRRISSRFPTRLYEFDDAASAISEVRQHLTVDMADQANVAFEYVTTYYQQLHGIHNPQ